MRDVARFAPFIVILLVGCGALDSPAEPAHDLASVVGEELKHVPQVLVQLPENRPPWDTSDVALAAAIEAGDNEAIVAFKNPAAKRLMETSSANLGVRSAVPTSVSRAGLELLDKEGVTLRRYLKHIGAAIVRFEHASQAIHLRNNPLVDYIEPVVRSRTGNAHVNASSRKAGSDFTLSSSQSTPWGITKVAAPAAWGRTTGMGAKVLIIDTGHNRGHPDLPYVPQSNCGGAYDGCSDAAGAGWHGSHVLGIVAARNNTVGVVGVAPGIKPEDVYVWAACNPNTGACQSTSIVQGIDQAITWDVDVINMSFGSDTASVAESNAIEQAYQAGIVSVASAGNHCHNHQYLCQPNGWKYPAADWRTIAVSGINESNAFAHPGPQNPCWYTDGLGTADHSSNYGPYVTITAPFHANSTVGDGTGYKVYCGTSMSAPHITGAVALIRAMAPGLTPAQIKERLIGTTTDLGPVGFDQEYGHGLPNLYRFVGPHAGIFGPTVVPPGRPCSWDAQVVGGYGSITYTWRRNGVVVSSSSSYSVTNVGFTSFTLQLTVHDAHNIQSSTSIYVETTGDPGARSCTF